jgi:hypothetical protein
VQIPDFILRKLYRKGSLREVGGEHFAFELRNVLGTATIVKPPVIVVNGIRHSPQDVDIGKFRLDGVTPDDPWVFAKGDEVAVRLKGRLLRAGNRIHVHAQTREFGDIELLVEDAAARPGQG